MAAPNLDPINVAATKNIMPGLADNFFQNDPLLEYLKARYHTYPGGPQIQENFLYAPMKGGPYAKGQPFDTSKRQTTAGLLFGPKYYQCNVSEYLEDVEVENAGPTAVLSMVKTDLGNAALTMSAILAIALYRHGSTGRTLHLNGLEEALQDGINASWSGLTATSYGSQARADVGAALKTPAGLIPANVAGPITFRTLEHSYLSLVKGAECPVLGVTTNRCMGYIGENFQPHQKVDTIEPTIGYIGIKFKKATIVEGQYVPGADGVNDSDIGDYSNSTETFWWLNPGPAGEDAYIKLRISTSKMYQFGFTGFKPGRDDTMVSGQVLFCGNVTCRSPRLSRVLHGING